MLFPGDVEFDESTIQESSGKQWVIEELTALGKYGLLQLRWKGRKAKRGMDSLILHSNEQLEEILRNAELEIVRQWSPW